MTVASSSETDVGVRALRDNLSRRLAEVRAGRVLTVTVHGKPIARIVPVGELTALERLRAEGRITTARHTKRQAPDPVTADGTVSDLVRDQRR